MWRKSLGGQDQRRRHHGHPGLPGQHQVRARRHQDEGYGSVLLGAVPRHVRGQVALLHHAEPRHLGQERMQLICVSTSQCQNLQQHFYISARSPLDSLSALNFSFGDTIFVRCHISQHYQK